MIWTQVFLHLLPSANYDLCPMQTLALKFKLPLTLNLTLIVTLFLINNYPIPHLLASSTSNRQIFPLILPVNPTLTLKLTKPKLDSSTHCDTAFYSGPDSDTLFLYLTMNLILTLTLILLIEVGPETSSDLTFILMWALTLHLYPGPESDLCLRHAIGH